MKKILLINPNTSVTTTAMMVNIANKHLARIAPHLPLKVDGYTVTCGPSMITTEEELEAAVSAVADSAVLAKAQHYDAIIVSAFGDPGLVELQQQLPIPVVGIGESAMRLASQDGQHFGIATTTPKLEGSTLKQVTRYGLAHYYTGIQLTAEAPLALAQQPVQQTAELANAVERCIISDQAETVIIGGGPLGEAAVDLQSSFDIPIINPIEAACLAVLHRLQQPRHDTA